MFLSVATTHRPASDLGFLLMKHPDRAHEVELGFGRAHVFFPQADDARCEAVLALEIDPVALVRGRGVGEGLLDQYVNDRPYAASSFLSVALNKAFRSAMSGVSRERPELAARAIPLEIVVSPLPARGGAALVERLFAPLGWSARTAETAPGSRYVELRLTGEMRLADALNHLYVLIPVMDEDKHYWVGDDEVEKLVARGGDWLGGHPERELIARRYLKHRRDLSREALRRLAPETAVVESAPPLSEVSLEAPAGWHDLRLETVAALLEDAGAKTIADLGCGEGKLIARLVRNKRFESIVGVDVSARALERAAARLKGDAPGGPAPGRVRLLHGALTYRDARWEGVDAAALVEVIEHLEPDRLPALEEVVFGAARPATVVVTTPNAEYNALFAGLPKGAFRHPDHRFEWTRARFQGWAEGVARRRGYSVAFSPLGEPDPEHGPLTQIAVFTR